MELSIWLSLKIPFYPFTDMPKSGKKSISYTRVGNQYDQKIYVKVAWEQKYLEASKAEGGFGVQVAGVGVGGGLMKCTQTTWKTEVPGLSLIQPGYSLKFTVDSKDSDLVFITIIAENGEVLCNALSRSKDENLLVLKNGQVCTASENPQEPSKDSATYHEGSDSD